MTLRTKDTNGETPISPTELRALRRLAEPTMPASVEAHGLWASRYRILEPIGHGGMGDVYLAQDVLLDRLVALKVLRNSDEDLVDERRLLREARAAARAEHERIARVYDAGTWNDRAFIAMEFVRGETLREWTKKNRPTPEEVVFIVQQLLEGLRALHERGLVHRDLKPENVMVASDGNLRILDLGIARRVPLGSPDEPSADWPSSLSLGFGIGTPGYMAPEQWQGVDVDARADLFALAVITYELVVGIAPFKGSNNAVIRDKTLHAAMTLSEPEWENMPASLRDVTRIALSRDRGQRFASVERVIEALAPLFRPSIAPISGARAPSNRSPAQDGISIDSSQASALGVSIRALPPAKPRWLRNRLISGLAAVLAAMALLGGMLWQRKASRPVPPLTHGMVDLPGGVFSMGSDAEELAAACATYPRGCPPEAQNEVPKRAVTVAPFEIDEREVTNAEFAAFLNDIGPSLRVLQDPDDHYDRFVRYMLRANDAFLLYDLWPGEAGIEYAKEKPEGFRARSTFENLPVIQVSWLGARLFCKSLGKRLATEAEWEFAAGGPERRPYPWGSKAPDCRGVHLASKGWLSVQNPDRCDSARQIPFPVMSAPQDITPDGVKDLGGNVAEWVDQDERANDDESTYVKRLTAETPAIFRGGAFDMSFMTRSTARNFRLAFDVAGNIGFRCAKSAPISHH